MSLSKLLTRSTLKVSQLGLTDQGTITQTISKGSVGDAETLIDGLQTQSDQCQQQWTALASWQTQSVKYQSDLVKAAHSKPKITVPASDAPGPLPPRPDLDSCAPAAAFGIPASALPPAQPVTPPPAPATTPTAKPSVTASAKATAKKTPAAG
jgi:N-acetylmuramoyl-L-alanine amidase